MLSYVVGLLGALGGSESAPAERTNGVASTNNRHDHWAVLVAGSSGYGNYRHQADVCHAYQVVISKGIPAEHVIVLAYDDIADSRENPFPGQVFNKPTVKGTKGVDVYKGCIIDYKGADVTPQNFVSVLTGDTAALSGVGSGRALGSSTSSRVFVNFVDHGGVGLIGFPRSTMHATELIGALHKMYERQLYLELVFYLEACESGSMFELLPNNTHIYATSAANAHESSWGTYCPPDDQVDGVSLRTCLGDLYSVNWMEDADSAFRSPWETLDRQYRTIKNETSKSHVLQFGDVDNIGVERATNFEGNTDPFAVQKGRPEPGIAPAEGAERGGSTSATHVSLPSADAELASAFARFMASGGTQRDAADELVRGVAERLDAAARFDSIVHKAAPSVGGVAQLDQRVPRRVDRKIDLQCHYRAHVSYVGACGEWKTADLRYSATLAQLCEYTKGEARPIVAAIAETCVAAA